MLAGRLQSLAPQRAPTHEQTPRRRAAGVSGEPPPLKGTSRVHLVSPSLHTATLLSQVPAGQSRVKRESGLGARRSESLPGARGP